MASPTLALAGVTTLVAAFANAYVGYRFVERARGHPHGRALRFFALWWGALAANMLLVGSGYLAGSQGWLSFEMQATSSYLQRLLLSVSLVGLMQYLLYLLTERDFARHLSAAYAAFFLLATYSFFRQEPVDAFVGAWRTDVEFARPAVPWLGLHTLFFVVLPPVVAALAYFRLFFHVRDPTSRYRIALVSWSIVGWWTLAVLAGQRALLDVGPLQSVQRALSLVAATAAFLAYHPPAWVRRRLAARAAEDAAAG